MITVSVPTPGTYKIALTNDGHTYDATEVITRDTVKVAIFHACQKLPRERISALLKAFGAANAQRLKDSDIGPFVNALRAISA
jgi:hypothetical protein